MLRSLQSRLAPLWDRQFLANKVLVVKPVPESVSLSREVSPVLSRSAACSKPSFFNINIYIRMLI